MLVQVWLALFAAGILTSIAAFAAKTASLYSALMNIFIWLVVGISALELTVVSNGTELTVAAPAVAVLAAVNAVMSLPVAYLAATGQWGDTETDDGLDSTTGRMDPDVPHPGARN